MASTLALRKLISSSVVPRSFRALRPVATSRLFNTDAIRRLNEDSEDDPGVDLSRRSDRSVSRRRDDFFSDVFDPFSPTRSLSQLLNLIDRFADDPLLTATRGGIGVRRGWDARETDDALMLRIDMPGLGKEDVKVTVDQNTLVIKGEGAKEKDSESAAEEEGGRRYTSRIDLPVKVYRTDQIKAEMKNGVLKVVVPKVKEEERANVRHIDVN